MDKAALIDLIYIVAFVSGGLGLGIAPLALSLLLAPRRTRSIAQKTLQPIECGIMPIGDAMIRYGVVYYLYALIFVAFSVDVLFLLPIVLVYREFPGWMAFFEVTLFVAILALVIVYAWKKGVFRWISRVTSRKV